MRLIKFILSLIITVGLIIIYQFKTGPLPPLGKFFSPFEGFWKNAEKIESPENQHLQLPGLTGKARIVYDDRLVPHIFADNEEDLYFLQGYVTAQHRLWQMDMQVRVAEGRLAEIIGPTLLQRDIEARRLGMKLGAMRSLEMMKRDKKSAMIINRYSAGVNAWINRLDQASLPLEYKLLDFKPEPWQPVKTALLLKYMANMLTGYDNDFENTNAVKLFGVSEFNRLFPEFPDTLLDPIIPIGTPFYPAALQPDTPSVNILKNYTALAYPFERPDAGYGSNNWAVSGSRTASGKTLLSNDPHLGLNLPSIWFEIQLECPGMSVYGASIPGAPCVISGFNDSIAWGITNASEDVKDWYTVQFKDKTRKFYRMDNVWKPTSMMPEVFKVRGGKDVIDTIIYTEHGPVALDEKFNKGPETINMALRWTAHDPSNELLTFYELNKGADYFDYTQALSHYWCPGQNFVFASATGDIAIWHQGKFVNRWPQQGRFIMDGSRSDTKWQGFIPQEHNPHILNPERGWVSSANQHPTDQTFPYYYSGIFEYFRNRRINEVLATLNKATATDMMELQNDNFNLCAKEALQILIPHLLQHRLSAPEKSALNYIKNWNLFNDPNEIAPIYFECWWDQFRVELWDEFASGDRLLVEPGSFQTIRFIEKYPGSDFIDNKTTATTENLDYLVTTAFHKAIKETEKWKNSNPQTSFTWANFKNTTVTHLSQQAAFSVPGVQTGGNAGIVNATSHKKGASWRMVVSPGTDEAYGIYPGGQSGNPGSKYYANFIEDWAKGKYFKLLLLKADQQHDRILFVQQVEP